MPIDVRTTESTDGAEVFLTAVPEPATEPARQAEEVFSAIQSRLAGLGARLLQERVFADEQALPSIASIRAEVYGALDDGVPPAWLVSPPGEHGPVAGVQVHAAVAKDGRKPDVVILDGRAVGRHLDLGRWGLVTLSGVTAMTADQPALEAREMFERAEAALRQVGGGLPAVARTWLWLARILDWYPAFNLVRTAFFRERGLIHDGSTQARVPASTGIGVQPAGGWACALDLVALVGQRGPMTPLSAAGNQKSPYEYGSAFSRALRAATPGGETVYVSGTAAIDAAGRSLHLGDPPAQIAATLDNVRAVLRDTHCHDRDVVHAIAYCKTAEVERAFQTPRRDLSWPCLTTIADICRPELLFEVEVTACPGAKSA
jgi:enamine deaminase RidA (YjgF/YER057c/UK114 family)